MAGALMQGDAPDRLRPYMHLVDAEPLQDRPPHPLERLLEHMTYPEWQLEATKPIKYKVCVQHVLLPPVPCHAACCIRSAIDSTSRCPSFLSSGLLSQWRCLHALSSPQGLEDTPFTVVETLEQLQEMAAQLGDSRELAVDLEHHSFRSFQGFTCVMQLSDRRADFVVDVLKLRHHIGPLLAPLFADPQVRCLASSNPGSLQLHDNVAVDLSPVVMQQQLRLVCMSLIR